MPRSKANSPIVAKVKPLLRGHFHQEGFFFALGACAMLIADAHGTRAVVAALIYTVGLAGLLGISALYHRPTWKPDQRRVMRRLDHSAIYLLIAGTFTPMCLMAMPEASGNKLLLLVWIIALFGIFQAVFWVSAPKWLIAVLYVAMGWMVLPFWATLSNDLGAQNFALILAGGVAYTVGAAIYAVRKPDPIPNIFGYHEIFHLLVMIGAFLQFIVVRRLLNP